MAQGCSFLDILRIVSILIAAFSCLVVVGYQALLPILTNEGIFRSLCTEETLNDENQCNKQILRLDLMYNITLTVLNMTCLLWGIVTLKYGSRIGVIIGGILSAISCILFSIGDDWLCFVSYILLGLGPGGIVFGIIGIPPQYPAIQGTLFSLVVGSFDASAGMFWIFDELYDDPVDISFHALFIGLAVFITIMSIIVYTFVYAKIFEQKEEKIIKEFAVGNASTLTESLLSDDGDDIELDKIDRKKKASDWTDADDEMYTNLGNSEKVAIDHSALDFRVFSLCSHMHKYSEL